MNDFALGMGFGIVITALGFAIKGAQMSAVVTLFVGVAFIVIGFLLRNPRESANG